VVTPIRNAIEHKEITLGASLDTEEGFSRPSFRLLKGTALSPRFAGGSAPYQKVGT
jgi:hypothetical protein